MDAKMIKNVMTVEDLHVLARLRGSVIKDFWDPFLDPRHLTASGVVINTSAGPLDIAGETDELGVWEGDKGWPAEYSRFILNSTNLGYPNIDPWQEAKKKGFIYKFHSGEEILDVQIERMTVSQFHFGEHTWDYETDSAIILVLSGGALAVCKVGLGTELLRISMGDSLEKLELPQPDSWWDHYDDLEFQFTRKRERFSVSELLNTGDGDAVHSSNAE